jgi:phospholipid/cholesterol/gamma-HCH transport system substrate-binding protein
MKQASIDREMTMELVVGTFMFMVLLALGYFTIVLGRASLFEKKFPLEVEFQDVVGLRKDDNVVLRGMTIGKVKTLRLRDGKVRVLAMLDAPVTLRTDYKIAIVTTSILGGRHMEVRDGSSDKPFLPPDVMPQGTKPYDLMAEAAETIHDIRVALNEGGILTNLQGAVASLHDVAAKIRNGEGTIGKLVNDEGLYHDFQGTVQDVRTLVARVQEITDKVNRGEGTLGKLIADDSVYTNLQAIAVNLREISDRVNNGEGTLGKLMAKDDSLYQDLSASVKSIREVTAKIEKGEGLLGKLVSDETLYQDVKSAVGEVRAAVDDFRETSPVVSFSTLLMGAF